MKCERQMDKSQGWTMQQGPGLPIPEVGDDNDARVVHVVMNRASPLAGVERQVAATTLSNKL